MLGPKGIPFDNDEVLDDSDDEDLKNDPVSQIDLQVRLRHVSDLLPLMLILSSRNMSCRFSANALQETQVTFWQS